MVALEAGRIVALSADALKNVTTAGAFVPLVIALIIVKFAVNAVVRAVVLVVALALGVLIYSQRSDIETCVDNARANIAVGNAGTVACEVAGFTIDLDI